MQVQAQGFKFTPVSGWLFKEVSEKVEGWDTKVSTAKCQVPVTSLPACHCSQAQAAWRAYWLAHQALHSVYSTSCQPYA